MTRTAPREGLQHLDGSEGPLSGPAAVVTLLSPNFLMTLAINRPLLGDQRQWNLYEVALRDTYFIREDGQIYRQDHDVVCQGYVLAREIQDGGGREAAFPEEVDFAVQGDDGLVDEEHCT